MVRKKILEVTKDEKGYGYLLQGRLEDRMGIVVLLKQIIELIEQEVSLNLFDDFDNDHENRDDVGYIG